MRLGRGTPVRFIGVPQSAWRWRVKKIADMSFDDWDRLGAEAGAEACRETWALGLPVTRGDDHSIERIWPDGRTETSTRARPAAAE